MKASDARLIEQTLDGDHSAYGELVRRYQDRLFNVVAHTLGCPSEAEDVVQDTFVQAFTKLASFRQDSAFYTWLYRIAVNAAISRGRKKRPVLSTDHQRELSGHEPPDHSEAPDLRMEREERANLVHEALGRLNDEHRIILVLREMDGRCYEEIAEILDLPIGTVRSRLHRARSHLKEQLEPMMFGSPIDRGT